MNFLGVDLAWDAGSRAKTPGDTGVVALDASGRIVDATWTVGVADTVAWVGRQADADALMFVDAPLVVLNDAGQRPCERQVGQRYGRWKVAANSTNLGSKSLAGVRLLEAVEAAGWRYSSGAAGPPVSGRVVSECYPYTTIVGAPALGYVSARPTYKRRPRAVLTADWPHVRGQVCDELIRRVAALSTFKPPIDLRSHPETRRLIDEPSPKAGAAYKRREDLLDAAICAWTAAYWHRHGFMACQVLGLDAGSEDEQAPTIIAPARNEQRRVEQPDLRKFVVTWS
jgi:predicted RNase H-like nuclease